MKSTEVITELRKYVEDLKERSRSERQEAEAHAANAQQLERQAIELSNKLDELEKPDPPKPKP